MKVEILFISLIFVCVVIQNCSCSSNKTTRCQQSKLIEEKYKHNPFFEYLNSRCVLFLEEPIMDKKTCHWEFSNHGSICETNSLRRYSNRDKMKINHQVKWVLGKIKRVSITLDATVATANKLFKVMKNEKKPPLLQTLQNEEFKRFSHLVHLTSNLKLKDSIKTCWAQIADLRSRSLCSACSARYTHFFKEEKALITNKICLRVLDNCTSTFEYFLEFLDAMKTFGTSIKSQMEVLAKKKLARYLSGAINNIIRVTDKIKSKNIITDMKQYHSDHSDNPQVAWNLCSSFINLGSDSFIKQLGVLFGMYRMSYFPNLTLGYKKQIKNLCKKIKTEARAPEKTKQTKEEIEETSEEIETCEIFLKKTSKAKSQSKSSIPSGRNLLFTDGFNSNWQDAEKGLNLANMTIPELNITRFTEKFLVGDVQVANPLQVEKNIDSSYTSYFGATGTTGNEVSRHVRHMPMNLTSRFP